MEARAERARRREGLDDELEFGELVDDDDGMFEQEEDLPTRTIDKKYKNTLESDEDDDEVEAERRNRLRAVNLKHRERKTIVMDGDIEVTPFNLKDELEDGYFDKTGNFVFDKQPHNDRNNRKLPTSANDDSEEDAWADGVHDLPVYNPAKDKLIDQKMSQPSTSGVKRNHEQVDSDDSDDIEGGDSNNDKYSKTSTNKSKDDKKHVALIGKSIDRYKRLITFMLPDETVQKTIQRLGKNVPRGRQFKQANKTKSEAAEKANSEKAKLDEFIEHTHKIMETFDLNIYEKTYQQLNVIIKEATPILEKNCSILESLERDLDSDD